MLRTAGGIALAVVIGVGMTACYVSSAPLPPGPPEPPDPSNLETIEIDGADIVLKHCGSEGKASHVDGNKFILNGQANLSNVGFYWEFPDSVKGKAYGTMVIEMEVISISRPNFVGLMALAKSDFSGAVNAIDKKTGKELTGSFDNEFKLGVECEKGAAGDTAEGGDGVVDGSSAAGVKREVPYPFYKFTDRIAFQVNLYAGNITTAGWQQNANETATYTIAVTKVTFPGGKPVEPPPPPKVGDVIFSLADWIDEQEDGPVANLPKGLVKAGNVTVEIVSGELVISDRSGGDWSGIDIQASLFEFDKYLYKVEITGSSAGGSGNVQIGQSGQPYGSFGVGAQAVGSPFSFTINNLDIGPFNGRKDGTDYTPAVHNMRINTNGGATGDITITDIKITVAKVKE